MNRPVPTIEPQPATLIRMFRDMLRIRMVEEEIAIRYGGPNDDQKMRCPVHLSIGQEAVAVGVSAVLAPNDQIVSTHRCHAHYLAKGGNLDAMLGELMGKATGCCGGRGGSMHLFDLDAGVLLSLPIVAASIPVGVGAAFAFQQEGKSSVAVVYLGDASLEEGVYHESANFAALKKLPVVFVCENNLYSVYTSLSDRQPPRLLTDLGSAHGLRAAQVDGNDVRAVHAAALSAVARARAGEGPSFILADTYRWREHCGPNYDNDLGYREVAEFEHWRARDPVALLRNELRALELVSDSDEARFAAEIRREIDSAFAAAEAAPMPDPASAARGLYA
jgi:TPP-dependent pyruvate/acetoin dehydrogenase alpha subunit